MPTSNFPGGFPNGLTVRGLPVLNSYAGNIFWVDSGAGSNGNAGTFNKPFATIDYAVGQATASNGDQIHIKPGHAENISSASFITVDVAGLTFIGHGHGNQRPTLTWTAAAGTIVVSAADTVFSNILMIAGITDTAVMISVTATEGFSMYGCQMEDQSTTVEWLVCVQLATGQNGVTFVGNKLLGLSATNNDTILFDGTVIDLYIANNFFHNEVARASSEATITLTGAATAAYIGYNTFVSSDASVISCAIDGTGSAAHSGMCEYNNVSVLDAGIAITDDPIEVTGMGLVQNLVTGAVDVQGFLVPAANAVT